MATTAGTEEFQMRLDTSYSYPSFNKVECPVCRIMLDVPEGANTDQVMSDHLDSDTCDYVGTVKASNSKRSAFYSEIEDFSSKKQKISFESLPRDENSYRLRCRGSTSKPQTRTVEHFQALVEEKDPKDAPQLKQANDNSQWKSENEVRLSAKPPVTMDTFPIESNGGKSGNVPSLFGNDRENIFGLLPLDFDPLVEVGESWEPLFDGPFDIYLRPGDLSDSPSNSSSGSIEEHNCVKNREEKSHGNVSNFKSVPPRKGRPRGRTAKHSSHNRNKTLEALPNILKTFGSEFFEMKTAFHFLKNQLIEKQAAGWTSTRVLIPKEYRLPNPQIQGNKELSYEKLLKSLGMVNNLKKDGHYHLWDIPAAYRNTPDTFVQILSQLEEGAQRGVLPVSPVTSEPSDEDKDKDKSSKPRKKRIPKKELLLDVKTSLNGPFWQPTEARRTPKERFSLPKEEENIPSNLTVYSLPGRIAPEIPEGFQYVPWISCPPKTEDTPTCHLQLKEGLEPQVSIQKSSNNGWSVFATRNIPMGTCLGEYSGDVLKISERCAPPACSLPLSSEWVISSQFKGNESRFIRHFSDSENKSGPNIKMTTVIATDGLHLLCFASKDIPSGSELLRDLPFLPGKCQNSLKENLKETLPEIPEEEIIIQSSVTIDVEGETFQGDWRGVKVMLKRYNGDLLTRESRLLRQFLHPNVIQTFGWTSKNSEEFLVLEWAPMGTLFQWRQSPLFSSSLSHFTSIFRSIAAGMSFLHANDFILRSLSPTNIWLFGIQTENPNNMYLTAKISDLSLSDFWNDNQNSNKKENNWLAPEIIQGEKCSSKVDVYSFGLLMESFWVGATCPSDVESLIRRCCAQNEKCRPTFPEILRELDNIIA